MRTLLVVLLVAVVALPAAADQPGSPTCAETTLTWHGTTGLIVEKTSTPAGIRWDMVGPFVNVETTMRVNVWADGVRVGDTLPAGQLVSQRIPEGTAVLSLCPTGITQRPAPQPIHERIEDPAPIPVVPFPTRPTGTGGYIL